MSDCDKFISRGHSLAARMLGDEMMIMAVTDSTLFSLNETASVIWQAADGVTPLRAIVEREIASHFDVDADTAYQHALEFVEELAQHGIIRVTDQPVTKEST